MRIIKLDAFSAAWNESILNIGTMKLLTLFTNKAISFDGILIQIQNSGQDPETQKTIQMKLLDWIELAIQIVSEEIYPLIGNELTIAFIICCIGVMILRSNGRIPFPNSEPFDSSIKKFLNWLIVIFLIAAVASYIQGRIESPLLNTNDPVELYKNAESLNSSQQNQTQKMIYGRAARLANYKAYKKNRETNQRTDESFLMEYIAAKSYYNLGQLQFIDQQYKEASHNLGLAISRYGSSSGFAVLKDNIFMQDIFNNINDPIYFSEEFDREEVYHSQYLRAISEYRQWKHSQGSNNPDKESLVESIELYRRVLRNDSKNQYYDRGSVWYDLGKAYQDNRDFPESRKAFLASYLNENRDSIIPLKELGAINEDNSLAITNEELNQALRRGDGLEVYHSEDPLRAIGDDLPNPANFLELHYGKIKEVVAVDDIDGLTHLYNSKYHPDFRRDVDLRSFIDFWINDVSEVVDFSIMSVDERQEDFKVAICLIRNSKQETLISTFPVVWESPILLIGKATASEFQDGCILN